jgi:cytidyltransferase-like protein
VYRVRLGDLRAEGSGCAGRHGRNRVQGGDQRFALIVRQWDMDPLRSSYPHWRARLAFARPRRFMTGSTRVYVDMVGDLFHAGHVALLRAARELGDHLVVGVLSDETAASYKRLPIMTLTERVAVIEACRYVDEVIPDAPDRLTTEFLDEHNLALVVHGDDVDAGDTSGVYGVAVESGRLRLVPRTGNISTTDLIARVHSRQE